MKALHSSSAIAVNLFGYWNGKNLSSLLYACRLISRTKFHGMELSYHDKNVEFESQFEISENNDLSPKSPNIDIILYTNCLSDVAIESKFSEPYNRRKHSGIKQKYIDNPSFWDSIPNLYQLAKEISPNNNKYKYLDTAELIKHILGLIIHYSNHHKSNFKTKFTLLYIWYDVLGKDGWEHKKEIEQFAEIAKKDNIRFKHITYQEVITTLIDNDYDEHKDYCDYMANRYL